MTADAFAPRHIGPSSRELAEMLAALGLPSLDALVDETVPGAIRALEGLDLPPALGERAALERLASLAAKNQVFKSYIGMGYHDTVTPGVVLRNIVENPAWYTAYTPYQAEIAQGRLEALLVFQTMVQDLTGLAVSNASLLDEATAAAEAMTMSLRLHAGGAHAYFVAADCHPQTLAVVQTRAKPLGIEVVVGDPSTFDFSAGNVFGALVQYPATDGSLCDHRAFTARAHAAGACVAFSVDLLALALVEPPSAQGADIAIGSTQRFGVPMGFGGPHAAFLATSVDFARKMPGRLIGVSRDRRGRAAYRMALQTREQHIRREKATSNICTAQVLLAVVAAMYAVYHGPEGIRGIARAIHDRARRLATGLRAAGFEVGPRAFFDTITVAVGDRRDAILASARARRMNLREIDAATLGVSLDETTSDADVAELLAVFGAAEAGEGPEVLAPFARQGEILRHEVFRKYRSETEMLRYLYRLQQKDLSLTTAMIPLGSCTMKLNATAEMIPVTWPGFARIHPFAPADQVRGYAELIDDLERWLAEITGYDAVSMQPNAGSQGEYAGLLTIAAWHASRGEAHRDVCLIPKSAHGTNPATAAMAGFEVVVVGCDDHGNIDVEDLAAKASANAARLAAIMVTYPSTHGVFEERITEICEIVHAHGGQVYIDGANLNAMVGLCKPGRFGGDVSHLNLHKTFAIPHGGGGPGMGPIAVRAHLAPFLPGHPVVRTGGETPLGTIAAAPFGSGSILPISWAYVAMLGAEGLTRSSQVATLAANYVAKRLEGRIPVLYAGRNGRVAHECILDFRPFKASSGVEVTDVAKRLQDYGFHGPTMSWPVAGTLMVEPTESEAKGEIDRLCDALLAIVEEIEEIAAGRADRADNVLKNAPHTADEACGDDWKHGYGREKAVFPTEHTRRAKFWPAVSRVDDVYGDKHLQTTLIRSS